MKDGRDAILRALDADGDFSSPALPAPPPMPTAAGDDLAAVFAAASAQNQSQVRRIADLTALPAAVAAHLAERGAAPQALCEREFLQLPWREAGLSVAHRAPQTGDPCGVTGVLAAAANNGVLLLADDVPHRLTMSLTPPHHIAVVPRDVICPDLPAVWRRLPRPLPRGCVLAAGPSRTADIEQTLTLGAHGPITVLVVVVG